MDIIRFIAVATKDLGRIGKEIAIIIGHLLKGLIVLTGRKARSHGKPTIVQLGRWFKEQTIVFVRKAKPKAIEAGQISKGLLILAVRKLKTKGIPMVKWIAQLLKDLSSRFYRKAKEVAEEKVTTVRKDIATGKTKDSEAVAVSISPSPEVILKEEEATNPNDKLAREIIQNGIECKALKETGLLEIEKKPYYSYLFAMSPRITTNRGCIRLEGNGKRNIDFVQVIQKN
jgi:hypothetical protein